MRTIARGRARQLSWNARRPQPRRQILTAPRSVLCAVVLVTLAGCGGTPSEPTRTPAVSGTPSLAIPTEESTQSWPGCESELNPGRCNEVVGRVFAAGGTGMHAPSDVLMESACGADGCRATLTLIAPDGFMLTAELMSDGPDDRWQIISMTRDPGGPVPVPSGG